MNNDPTGFAKMVPGFDFLQSLAKNAGSAIPGIGQWVAPTLDPAELEKRIEELRTVQFWLEQNARMLAATIQALEVQRMTLSTLQTMNVQMGDLRESLKIKLPGDGSAAAGATEPKKAKAAGSGAPAVDPMQWWGALTNQFAQLATSAMKGSATDAAQAMAGGLVKQTFDAATAPARAVMDAAGKKSAKDPGSSDTAGARPAAKKAAPRRRRSPAAKAGAA